MFRHLGYARRHLGYYYSVTQNRGPACSDTSTRGRRSCGCTTHRLLSRGTLCPPSLLLQQPCNATGNARPHPIHQSQGRVGGWEGFRCLPHPIHQSWWGESVVVNLCDFAPNHGRGCAADAPNAARARRRTCARHLCYGRTRVPLRGRPSSETNRTDRALRTPRLLEPRSGHLVTRDRPRAQDTSVTSHA